MVQSALIGPALGLVSGLATTVRTDGDVTYGGLRIERGLPPLPGP